MFTITDLGVHDPDLGVHDAEMGVHDDRNERSRWPKQVFTMLRNTQSAAASLAEGLEETLTLHRLGVYELLGISFKTTNCLESANALVEERCAKVDAWKTSHQRHRWLATALLDIEPRLRRVRGHRHLSKLITALRRALNIKEQQNQMEEAA